MLRDRFITPFLAATAWADWPSHGAMITGSNIVVDGGWSVA